MSFAFESSVSERFGALKFHQKAVCIGTKAIFMVYTEHTSLRKNK